MPLLAGCSGSEDTTPTETPESTVVTDSETEDQDTDSETSTQENSIENVDQEGWQSTSLSYNLFVGEATDYSNMLNIRDNSEDYENKRLPDLGPSQEHISVDQYNGKVTTGSNSYDPLWQVIEFMTIDGATQFFEETKNRWGGEIVNIEDRGDWLIFNLNNDEYGAHQVANLILMSAIPSESYSDSRQAIIDQIQSGGGSDEYGKDGYYTGIVDIADYYQNNIEFNLIEIDLPKYERHQQSMNNFDKRAAENIMGEYFDNLTDVSSVNLDSGLDVHTAFTAEGKYREYPYENLAYKAQSYEGSTTDDITVAAFESTSDLQEFLSNNKQIEGSSNWMFLDGQTYLRSHTSNGAIIFDSIGVSPSKINTDDPNRDRDIWGFVQEGAFASLDRIILSSNVMIEIEYFQF
jgi:hypothetical protein